MNATAFYALDKFIAEELIPRGIAGDYMVYAIGDDEGIFKVLIGDDVQVEVNNIRHECTKFTQVARLYEQWRHS
jgi:hypothetical protein